MPLIFNRAIDDATRVGLWHITETCAGLEEQIKLEPADEARYTSFKSEVRKKQWLSYRILLQKMMFPELPLLEYDEFGKPRLKGSSIHISISHSGEYAAVITSKSSPVGIDIERLKDRILRINDRFLSAEEDRMMAEPNRLEKLYVAWGVKEALYKIHGKPEVEFQRDIFIGAYDYLCNAKGRCTAGMKTPSGVETCDVFYEKIGDYMLVYALKNERKR